MEAESEGGIVTDESKQADLTDNRRAPTVEIETSTTRSQTGRGSSDGQRLVSLDALRGFTMFWIIGGDQIMRALPKLHDNSVFRFLDAQLRHTAWHGFTFYDLIFPLFLFIIGVAVPFSNAKRLEKGAAKRDLYVHAFKRAAGLFILGLIYYGIKDPNLEWLGYYGVLQRLAIGYFFASLIMLGSGIRTQAIWAGGLLLFYFMIMKFVPVPGFGAGALTPEGNLGAYWTSLLTGILGIKMAKLLLLSLIPTVSTALLGILAGHWLRSTASPEQKAKGLLFAGVGLVIGGLVWGIWMPINKLLWDSSYVLFTGGISSILLAVCYWVIEIKGRRTWAFFFVVIGLNPITIYMLARVIDFGAIVTFFTQGFIDYFGAAKPLVHALLLTALHWMVVYWLYKRKIFLRV